MTAIVHFNKCKRLRYSSYCKEAKLQARIKPTAFCSAIDKENSMEFSLISLPTHTLYYCGYALIFPWSSCYSSHVTPCDCDLWHDHLWPSITPIVTLWQSHVILFHAPSCSCKFKEKEKERKRNINNNLAVLPSHNSYWLSESIRHSLVLYFFLKSSSIV